MAISKVKGNILKNQKFAYFTKGIAATVFVTTGLKAVGRPAFIYADKRSDKETKRYTAAKEFLYQVLCLGMSFAMVIPFQKLGFAMAKKYVKNIAEFNKIKNFKEFEKVTKDLNNLTDEAKKILGTDKLSDETKSALKLVNGGVQLGSFIGSILGLTIIAPLISHQILHPIMKAIGLEEKEKPIGHPTEIFLADAKLPTDEPNKLDVRS